MSQTDTEHQAKRLLSFAWTEFIGMLAAVLARGDAGTLRVGGPPGIWDHAAGILLAEESGYCVTNAAGGAFPSGWTETKSMIALLGMLVAKHVHKVALVPDGQKQAAFVV